MDPISIAALISGIGSGIGGLASLFGSKQPSKTEQVPLYNQQQQGAFDQLLKMGIGGLTNPEQNQSPIAQNARKQFNERSLPSLIERLGSAGAAGTSGFNRAVTGAAGDFESALASLQHQQALQLLGLGLTPQTSPVYQPEGPGGLQTFGANLGGNSFHAFLSLLPELLKGMQGKGDGTKSPNLGLSDEFNTSAGNVGNFLGGQSQGGSNNFISMLPYILKGMGQGQQPFGVA